MIIEQLTYFEALTYNENGIKLTDMDDNEMTERKINDIFFDEEDEDATLPFKILSNE